MPAPTITECTGRQPWVVDNINVGFTREWDIIATSEQDSLTVLLAQTGIKRGTVYADHQGVAWDTLVICQRLVSEGRPPAPVAGSGLYHVTAYYSYPNVRLSLPPFSIDGTPRFRIETAEITEPADFDVNGVPILNTVDEPLSPTPTIESVQETLVIDWIETATNWLTAYNRFRPYHGKVNSAPFLGIPVKCLKMKPVIIEDADIPLHPTSLLPYFRFTVKMDIRAEKTVNGITYPGWLFTRLNMGRRLKATPADNQTAPFKGIPQVDLDLLGKAGGEPVYINSTGTAVVASYNLAPMIARDLYLAINYAGMLIPGTT